MSTYKGFFKPKNSSKYSGSLPIIYRSSWELCLMKWCDSNPNVLEWGSESVIIPYFCSLDKKYHKYFPDFIIKFKDIGTYIIEIKPKKQTIMPNKNKTGRMTKRYLREVCEYERNYNKWKAAHEYSKVKGYIFQVWTEDTLKKIGISIL